MIIEYIVSGDVSFSYVQFWILGFFIICIDLLRTLKLVGAWLSLEEEMYVIFFLSYLVAQEFLREVT